MSNNEAQVEQVALPMEYHDPPLPRLTDKQKAFCLEYVQVWNASEAYRRAYNSTTVSEESVRTAACELLADPRIKAYIDHLRSTLIDDGIASARWWASVMFDETQPLRDRLKASELLAKA